MDFLFLSTADPETAVSLTLDARKVFSVLWLMFVIYGIGRLGLFYPFKQLPRFERIALRIVVGICAMIVLGVIIHAVGFGIGLSDPRYHSDDGFPAVSPGPLGFGVPLLLILSVAGYALDIRDFIQSQKTAEKFIWFPGLHNKDGRIGALDALNYFGPGTVVVLTALYWFQRFYRWAMAYAWLADNDPWDHAWATDWIIRSGSFYEPLAQHPDPIQILHYLDAYPPGMDMLLAIPTFINSDNINWSIKFVGALVPAIGLYLIYPSLVKLAEIGLAAFTFKQSGETNLELYSEANQESPRLGLTPLMSRARWIGALGVFAMSCVPGWPSRFIWSHSLVHVLSVAAFFPIILLPKSWKWMIPTVWILAATQLTTTVYGFKFGFNIVMLLFAVMTFLPGRERTAFYKRPAFYALPIFVIFSTVIWRTFTALNDKNVERAYYTLPGTADSEPPKRVWMPRFAARDLIRYIRLERYASSDLPDESITREAIALLAKKNDLALRDFISEYRRDRLKKDVQSDISAMKATRAALSKPDNLQPLIDLEKLARVRRLSDIVKASDDTTEPSVIDDARAELDAIVGGSTLDDVIGSLEPIETQFEPNQLTEIQAFIASPSATLVFNGLSETNVSYRIALIDDEIKSLGTLSDRIETEILDTYGPDSSTPFASLVAKPDIASIIKDDSLLHRLVCLQTDAMTKEQLQVMNVRRTTSLIKDSITLANMDELERSSDVIDETVASLKVRAILLIAGLLILIMAAYGAHRLLYGRAPAIAGTRLLQSGVIAVTLSLFWWFPMLLRYGGQPPGKVRVRSPEKTVRQDATDSRKRRGADDDVAAALSGNIDALNLSETSGEPVAAPRKPLLKRLSDWSKLLETLAHPADIQLDRYYENPPWKFRGTQDRTYYLWEFVHPPPKIGIQDRKLHNSVTSGIGIGVPVAIGVFLFGAVGLYLLCVSIIRKINGDATDLCPAPQSDAELPTSDWDTEPSEPVALRGKQPKGKEKDSTPAPEPTLSPWLASAMANRPAALFSAAPDNIAYLSARHYHYGLLLGLAFMFVHAIVGLYGDHPDVPFQIIAFRYWHMVSFIGVCCSVVAWAWLVALMRNLKSYGLAVSGGVLIASIVLLAVTFDSPNDPKDPHSAFTYKQVALHAPEYRLSQYQREADKLQNAKRGRLLSEADRNQLDSHLNRYTVEINALKDEIQTINGELTSKCVSLPFVFLLLTLITTAVIEFIRRIIASNLPIAPKSGSLWSKLSPVAGIALLVVSIIGYMAVQGGKIRGELNDYLWNTTGVMDQGIGAESRTLERLIKSKDDMGMSPGERIFPLGGPYRFRFMIAAQFDVSYFDYDTYQFIHHFLLDPVRDPLGNDMHITTLEWFYDISATRRYNIKNAPRYVANIPVLPKLESGGYRYQPDPDAVSFDQPVVKRPWFDIDGLESGKLTAINRPDEKNFPKFFYRWLRENKYDYVWFDHVFFTFTKKLDSNGRLLPQHQIYDIQTGETHHVNLFETVLNDCLQSGYFELVDGQEHIAEYNDRANLRHRPFPNLPCYILRVRETPGEPSWKFWLPAPDTISYNIY